MERLVKFNEEHEMFRDTIRKFIEKEILENYSQWEEEGIIPRELWKKFGNQGFLLPWAEEKYGGAGGDYLFSVIVIEELARYGLGSIFVPLHSDIVAHYIDSFGSEEQKERWLPPCVSGDKILAVAMTEPEAGSDLASIKTRAIKDDNGWVLNGQKTFISNGLLADIIVVAAKTETGNDNPSQSLSLFVVERDTPGLVRGEPIKKIGLKAQDTVELFFDDCRVPDNNLLGDEGMGFIYLMQKLQPERLVVAIGCQAAAEAGLDMTIEYVKERILFGKPLSKFQNTQFKIAEMASELAAGRSFVDNLILQHCEGKDVTKETCMAKYFIAEMGKRVADECLQLYGGYGYCLEYPIARMFLDARIQTIYAGTSEIMKLVVARSMGL